MRSTNDARVTRWPHTSNGPYSTIWVFFFFSPTFESLYKDEGVAFDIEICGAFILCGEQLAQIQIDDPSRFWS